VAAACPNDSKWLTSDSGVNWPDWDVATDGEVEVVVTALGWTADAEGELVGGAVVAPPVVLVP
jgi:hypothetical protein